MEIGRKRGRVIEKERGKRGRGIEKERGIGRKRRQERKRETGTASLSLAIVCATNATLNVPQPAAYIPGVPKQTLPPYASTIVRANFIPPHPFAGKVPFVNLAPVSRAVLSLRERLAPTKRIRKPAPPKWGRRNRKLA